MSKYNISWSKRYTISKCQPASIPFGEVIYTFVAADLC